MHGLSTLRVGAGNGAAGNVVGELFFDLGGQSEGAQVRLHVGEGTSRCLGHCQVGAGTVFGPPPAPADASDDEEQSDERDPGERTAATLHGGPGRRRGRGSGCVNCRDGS